MFKTAGPNHLDPLEVKQHWKFSQTVLNHSAFIFPVRNLFLVRLISASYSIVCSFKPMEVFVSVVQPLLMSLTAKCLRINHYLVMPRLVPHCHRFRFHCTKISYQIRDYSWFAPYMYTHNTIWSIVNLHSL